MRIDIINYLACPSCDGDFSLFLYKKVKERVLNGELRCKKCNTRFQIKDGIACFTNPQKQTVVDKRKLRKTTIRQEIPKKWMEFFSKKELTALHKEWNWMLSTVKEERNALHLDFATGTGRFLRNIVSKTKGEVIALEHDYPTCLELQYFLKKIKKYNNVSIVCADAQRMPFKDDTFDSVSSWHGLDEPKMEKAIKETRRILKKGRYFAASGIHYKKGSKSFLIAKRHHIRFITKEAIIQALKEACFWKIEHKTFFNGRWTEKGDYLPVFNDFYTIYGVKAEK